VKYAPKDAAGRTPWVRTCTSWGRSHSSVLYTAEGKQHVKWAFRKGVHETVDVRRATPEDVATLYCESGYGPVGNEQDTPQVPEQEHTP
jgi:hypothetical protein